MRFLDRMLCLFARLFIRVYQLTLSPLLVMICGPNSGCLHEPSCSRYAMECFRVHPFPRALWLTVRRIGRCHPWGSGGHDPVPPGKK